MEYIGFLVSIAFVFALAALAQVDSLKKKVEKLKEGLESQNRNLDYTSKGDVN